MEEAIMKIYYKVSNIPPFLISDFVAHLVEHWTWNPEVDGSNLTVSTFLIFLVFLIF